jgi:subtilisin-like proprotein convertase family protein
MKSLPLIAILLGLPSFAKAAVTLTQTLNVSTAIPDNDDAGYSSNVTITANSGSTPPAEDISRITSVTVELNFSGGWNGDLYVYLVHGDGFAVLLNRIGRTAETLEGSSGEGMSILLADDAQTDVHQSGSASPLTGTYQPDGRNVDPLAVLDTDERRAMLSSFNGLSAAGDWTLFVADQSSGGQSVLESWTLTVTAIPEPSALSLMIPAAGLLLARRRRI